MKKFEDKVIEKKPLWCEMITKEVESRFTEINDDIDLVQKMITETKEKIMDNEDIFKRLNNIIMYNVEESKADIASDRNVDDMQFCSSVMEQVLRVGYEKGDIVKVVRLGRYEDAKKRPLLIELSNGHIKNIVKENVTKLGSAKDRFEGITISHDMTVKEREQCRELVEEAKKKEKAEMENFIYRVRGLPGQMKIVRFRKGERDCCEKAVVKDEDDLTNMYTNADSLVTKMEDLKLLVDSLDVKPNIIAITEVKSKHTKYHPKLSEFNVVITLSVMIWIQNIPHEELLLISIIKLIIVSLNLKLNSKNPW